MVNSSALALLENSISSFSKSALKALKDIEKQLAQATTDARDAQKERDNVLKQSRESQLQLTTQATDILAYKDSLVQAELTIDSQREIITSFQREVTHWKEQARNWQEHFTRVEEERCSLSTKLDEILTTQTFDQVIPTHLLESETIKRAAAAGYFPSPNIRSNDKSKSAIEDAELVEPPAQVRKPKAAGSRTAAQQSSKSARAGEPRRSDVCVSATTLDQSPDPAPSRLVRRVQAVVRVKSEDEEEEGPKSNDEQEATLQPTQIKQRRAPKRRTRIIQQDDKDWSSSREDESQHVPAAENGPASDEDDELILTSKDNHAQSQTNAIPPNKKRKLNNPKRQSKKS
ncbi:hypothetical protein APHAL10511_002612 [Amanita phalloides]|nr:hypothetical protein APHAL10511_002612 [Amanita phalloides]